MLTTALANWIQQIFRPSKQIQGKTSQRSSMYRVCVVKCEDLHRLPHLLRCTTSPSNEKKRLSGDTSMLNWAVSNLIIISPWWSASTENYKTQLSKSGVLLLIQYSNFHSPLQDANAIPCGPLHYFSIYELRWMLKELSFILTGYPPILLTLSLFSFVSF